jgi:hypothetical protein
MRLFRVFVLLAAVLVLANSVPAAVYEVAHQHPQANDDAPGSPERPWKSIAKAAEKAVAGDSVVIRGGVYRERVVAKNNGTAAAPIRFETAPGEQVIVTGADRLTGWERVEGTRPVYRLAWPHKFISWNPAMTHPGDEYHRLVGRCEQVMVDGYLLRQVLGDEQIAPGAFFADVTNRTLFVWDIGSRDLGKALVEASVRQEVFRVEGDYVQLRGLRFRYAANMAQHGAVVLAGKGGVMEDCVIESMNASGATFTGENLVVRRCVFRDNGQLGFGASRAHGLLFTECLVENNNTKGFDRGWEAGGDKLVLCRDAVLERSRFVRNRGTGIWFDIGNTNCTVRQCLIADNEDAGIFYEISFRLLAHDNVIIHNGFAGTAGAWGAQAGISLSSSPGCVVERNILAGNREGFNFREQTRTTPTIEDRAERPVWNHDELIRHNLIVLNRDAQVWGWFDVKDNRHWPASSLSTNQPATGIGAKPGDIAGAYVAAGAEGQPRGLTLEQLRLRFERNVYFAAPGRGWFKWGPTWARCKSYEGLREFQSDLRVDAGSQVFEVNFANLLQLDFRFDQTTMDRVKESYPLGTVPGVVLGVKR